MLPFQVRPPFCCCSGRCLCLLFSDEHGNGRHPPNAAVLCKHLRCCALVSGTRRTQQQSQQENCSAKNVHVLAMLPCAGAEPARMQRCFAWAHVLHDAACQVLSPSGVQKSLLAAGLGCDTEFSGGAAAWEAASACLRAAFRRGRVATAALTPLAACATCHNTFPRVVVWDPRYPWRFPGLLFAIRGD